MNPLFSFVRSAGLLLALAAVLLFLAGCTGLGHSSNPANGSPGGSTSDMLGAGDVVRINFSGVIDPPPAYEERIKEDGTINLPFIGPIAAQGKTRRELEDYVHKRYVPTHFSRLTVTVSSEGRTFTVRGEVAKPGSYTYHGQITLLKAIAMAGDFTDFGNRRNVQITRANGDRLSVNANRAAENPSLDVPIFPNDIITVRRRLI